MSRKPRAFRLDDPDVQRGRVSITEAPLEALALAEEEAALPARRRHIGWGGLLVSALGGLFALSLGLFLERLVRQLFTFEPALGWIALGLVLLALTAFLALVFRELVGLWRERKIERLRQEAIDSLLVKDHAGAKQVAKDVAELYAHRAYAQTKSDDLNVLDGEILDPEDRLAIVEQAWLHPLDEEAKRAVAAAAKQVSLVTALSPRAIVDVAFVVFAAVRLLRTLSRIYGGRPGFLGMVRLARAALSHLAVTGGVAIGDSMLQQVLGLGLAARISAKLGEGVLNGLMTARFGLAALAVCRPLPFVREMPPRIQDVAGELLSRAQAQG